MDDFEKVIAEIRKEFYLGLSGRLAAIRSALDALDEGFDGDAAHLLLRKAHSLEGTSASLGDEDLARAAAGLNLLALGWIEAGGIPPSELEWARDSLGLAEALHQLGEGAPLSKLAEERSSTGRP